MYIGQDDGTLLHEADSPPGKAGVKSNKMKSNQPTRADSPTRLREARDRGSRQDVLESDNKIQRQGTEAVNKSANKPMSTLRASQLSKAQSVNQSMASVPAKKVLGSAFDSELSEAGHYSAKVLEVTPKNKERSQVDFSEKSKKVILEPGYDSRADPIDQLRALALLKEQQPPAQTKQM